MQTTLSKNLRKLRLSKEYTQEQVAEQLEVSPQSVSRWECGSTFPDVMILPQIAKLYGVTVDDLFKENVVAYANYADRLCSIYEQTKHPEDFIRADREYRKLLNSGDYTTDDLRSYGILYKYMMNYSRIKALELFDKVLAKGIQEDHETYYQTVCEKMSLYCQIGKSSKNIEEQLKALEQNPEEPRVWGQLSLAYKMAGNLEEAYQWFRKALTKFPNAGALYVYGGDLCAEQKKWDEALQYWDKAVALDDCYLIETQYSKAFYYEKIEEWESAYQTWKDLVQNMEAKGWYIEMAFPKQKTKECEEKLVEIKNK